MKFEVGKYYSHEGGRQIAILSEFESIRWGKMFVVEAADITGFAVECMEDAGDADMGAWWVEIGKEEFRLNYQYVSCKECGKMFTDKSRPVKMGKENYHPTCLRNVTKERGAKNVEEVPLILQ